ncbi:TPA: resolvase [Streptococcus agalactiae]|nr:resolvase [Streptococcus agalactiae]HEN2417179.1 resolvase [Streptococcus agalactiae]
MEGKNQSNSSSMASGYYSLTCYQSISETGQIVVTFLEGTEVDL